MSENLYIKNKKAYFEYSILDKYTAGIKLLGTEIKSIREGKANLNDAFCTFIDNQLYVRNLHIAEYSHGSFYNHEAKRDRVLLLQKKELINYKNDKTNFDYYTELNASEFRQPFKTLSRQYEYAWYGNAVPSDAAYSEYLSLFNNVKKQLGE